jgi:hypothetical protein
VQTPRAQKTQDMVSHLDVFVTLLLGRLIVSFALKHMHHQKYTIQRNHPWNGGNQKYLDFDGLHTRYSDTLLNSALHDGIRRALQYRRGYN